MIAQTALRTVVDGWLRVARTPIDVVARLVPAERMGRRTPIEVNIDRLDGGLREKVGGLLGDDVLIADGRRRRIAADERMRAIELRLEAEKREAEADAKLQKDEQAAERRRAEAERVAEERREAVERERAETERRAEQAAAKEKQAAQAAKARKAEATEKRTRQKRLEVLDDQLEQLDARTDALTAADEAKRLRTAAASAKAARKNGS
ncbi:MAG: hypothetical protein Q8K58_05035 [Acidimicrobiales bacterium]|nr:hypothetical protein [Acidimicrobiales bacterium]